MVGIYKCFIKTQLSRVYHPEKYGYCGQCAIVDCNMVDKLDKMDIVDMMKVLKMIKLFALYKGSIPKSSFLG